MADALGEWSEPERVAEYLSREIPHRPIAEKMLMEALPMRTATCTGPGPADAVVSGLAIHS